MNPKINFFLGFALFTHVIQAQEVDIENSPQFEEIDEMFYALESDKNRYSGLRIGVFSPVDTSTLPSVLKSHLDNFATKGFYLGFDYGIKELFSSNRFDIMISAYWNVNISRSGYQGKTTINHLGIAIGPSYSVPVTRNSSIDFSIPVGIGKTIAEARDGNSIFYDRESLNAEWSSNHLAFLRAQYKVNLDEKRTRSLALGCEYQLKRISYDMIALDYRSFALTLIYYKNL